MTDIENICNKCDILFLQETWLSAQELHILSNVHSDFYGRGVSSVDEADGILTGRPFGGLAVLWKKSLGSSCCVELLDDTRLMLCKISNGPHSIALLNVYLPYDNGSNLGEYSFYLSKIDSLLSGYPYASAIGDFNANIANKHHRFGAELKSFCEEENWMLSDYSISPIDTFTFYSDAHHTVAWLDHIMSTTNFHSIVNNIWVEHEYVTSDHFPIFTSILLSDITNTETSNHDNKSYKKSHLNWSKMSAANIREYKKHTAVTLAGIQLNHALILCKDPTCKDPCHIAAIDTMYMQIIDALKTAEHEVLKGKLTKTGQYQQVPGWKEVCLEQHQQARNAFLMWKSNGKPKTGPIFHQMKTSKSNFKLLIRQCKIRDKRRESDILAHKFLNSKSCDFWKEIKKINGKGKKSTLPDTVDGTSGCKNICNMWKDYFSTLLNTSYISTVDIINHEDMGKVDCFTFDDVTNAINTLKAGKSAGKDGLRAEAFKHANESLRVYLCMFFNAVLCHGYIPLNLMDTIIVPVVKDKKGDLESKDNYRPIALTTVMSKIFEILILNRYENSITTTDHQFGFKQRHSTDMCVYTFKQVIEYYKSKSSPMYICFLDASKAFDRVNHKLLFKKLLDRNVPCLIVRVLLFWYVNQCFFVKWGSVLSQSFSVSRGVRQGGILSPILFNIYIDSLSVKLTSLSVGCHINSVCYNHLIYADDTVLLAPSPKALQYLIDECVTFATEHDLIFNTKKTKLMCIKPEGMKKLYIPDFVLGGSKIRRVQSETYLGYILNEHASDNDHIVKEMRNMYKRGNMLVKNFSHCTEEVKIALFKSFCSSIYCCPLWYNFRRCVIKKLHVACNKVFKKLMKVPCDSSASELFVRCNVDNFPALRRKLVYGLRTRVLASSNILINTFLCVNHGLNPMHRYWKTLLYL